jgi:ABC-type dipeptide/oligopeptide/nickel transport system permease component
MVRALRSSDSARLQEVAMSCDALFSSELSSRLARESNGSMSSNTLPWLPAGGTGTLRHLVLPAVSLGLFGAGVLARQTRSGMLEVLGQDFVRTARAKGLPERLVVVKHALKNALIPVVTVLGDQFGRLLGGAILTETVFSWPGMGRYLIDAISQRDYPAVQGAILVFAAAVVIINLLVDVSYGVVDPRMRAE